jgi:hypothetical protein
VKTFRVRPWKLRGKKCKINCDLESHGCFPFKQSCAAVGVAKKSWGRQLEDPPQEETKLEKRALTMLRVMTRQMTICDGERLASSLRDVSDIQPSCQFFFLTVAGPIGRVQEALDNQTTLTSDTLMPTTTICGILSSSGPSEAFYVEDRELEYC